jgi:outer membrane lipoprotein-sorting protein
MKKRWAKIVLLPLLLPLLAADVVKEDAAKALTTHLAALKDTETLEAKFVCEKRLALLETPLLSRGQLWIRKGDPKDGDGAVRFSTEKPYVSELILAKGKVHVRSQHETEWTKSNQAGRPGLTAVMGQLGGWSTGDAGKVTEDYSIAAATEKTPGMPEKSGVEASTQPALTDVASFVLTPTDKDLRKAVKRVTLSIDAKTHHLLFIEIVTQQDDTTRYWFYDVKTNAKLAADVFVPGAASPVPAARPDSSKRR